MERVEGVGRRGRGGKGGKRRRRQEKTEPSPRGEGKRGADRGGRLTLYRRAVTGVRGNGCWGGKVTRGATGVRGGEVTAGMGATWVKGLKGEGRGVKDTWWGDGSVGRGGEGVKRWEVEGWMG